MWMSLMPCSRSRARIGQVCPPFTAKRYLTPSEPRTPATRAPPSTGMAPEGASAGSSRSTIPDLRSVVRAAFRRCETIPQDAMLDLARRGARHLMLADVRDRARPLVPGDPFLAPREHVPFGHAAAVVQDDDGVDGFSPLLMRNADHCDVPDGRVRAEDLLDLRRIDVLAAAADHVALAVDQVVVAVAVATGDVADRAIVAAESLGGLLGQPPVALKDIGRACIDLARLPLGNLVAVIAEEFDPAGAGDLAADRSEPGQLLLGPEEGHPSGFRRTVALEQPRVPKVLHEGELGLAPRGR